MDAMVPADERYQVIERKSYRVGYFILLTGMIVVGVYKPLIEDS